MQATLIYSVLSSFIPDPQVNNARLPFGYTQGTSGQYSVIFQKKAEIICNHYYTLFRS